MQPVASGVRGKEKRSMRDPVMEGRLQRLRFFYFFILKVMQHNVFRNARQSVKETEGWGCAEAPRRGDKSLAFWSSVFPQKRPKWV